MTDTATTTGPELPQRTRTVPSQIASAVLRIDPADVVQKILDGEMLLAALEVFTDLEIADHLAQGPLPLSELAERCQAEAAALERILRTLIPEGFIRRASTDGRYHLAAVGQTLRKDAPRSMRPAVLTRGIPLWREAARTLTATVRTGRPAITTKHGTPYAYLAERPERQQVFQEFMTARSTAMGEALAEEDLSEVRQVVDVGGGRGTILAALLEQHPHCTGVLLERETVTEQARAFLTERDVSDRCEIVAGDFFTGVPDGGDLYLLASILHNWPDEQAHAILVNVRAAMKATSGSHLWCVDWLLPDSDMADPGLAADIKMLSLFPGGRERTLSAYTELLNGAGFTISATVPLSAGPSLVMAEPAQQ
ncbi:methyltransferase [Planomonospora sp. ID82291]|uniref:methyltransferase n=1 Tax=Planomonospora sp. ID82291 TaxID=2738136 RepID=UPI0018C3DAF4|nr:methyltransferase [Planomonospora sp. ID82291]MBG0818370.1 hydroxyneurosporene methyltransferase [Planomonospora sp. ID82291]